MVFDAHTKPELVRQWLLGPDGWTMPVCEIDLRAGGKYRYVWEKEKTGDEMGVGGEFKEVAKPEKYVATEKFDQSWYPGEALSTTTFTDREGKTFLAECYDIRIARGPRSRPCVADGRRFGSRLRPSRSVGYESCSRGLIKNNQ